MDNLFFLEFILTKKCNMKCEYCDLKEKGVTEDIAVDLDYIKWLLKVMPHDKMYIEVTGGEPGLVRNLDEVIHTLKSHKKVQRLQLMSNGLVRARFPGLVKEVDQYNEHIVHQIRGQEIVKFYNMEFVHRDNVRYVVVLDEITVTSILENFDYFKEYGLFDDKNFWLKTYVPRVDYLNEQHKTNLITLLEKLGTSSAQYWVNKLTAEINVTAQQVCKNISFIPAVDIANKKIIHCAYYNFSDSVLYDVTEENLAKLIDKKLFVGNHASYCDDCYLYYSDCEFLQEDNRANRRAITTAEGTTKFI